MITIRMHCGIHKTVEAFIQSMLAAGYALHKWSPSFELPLDDEAPRFCEAY